MHMSIHIEDMYIMHQLKRWRRQNALQKTFEKCGFEAPRKSPTSRQVKALLLPELQSKHDDDDNIADTFARFLKSL